MSSTVSLRITLRYKDLDEFGARYAENISSAGLFLRTRTPKPTGTRIRFELLLADGARAFFGEGVVVSVRHDDKAGMGIRYHSLDPDSQLVMEKIVAQHGEGPLAPTPLGIPAKQAGSSVWRPGAAPQWGAAPPARPSAPPSSGGLLPRDGWGRPRTPPKSDAPPPPKEVRRRSATLRPWERTGSEVAQAPKAPETPDDLSRTLLLPEWDDLARTTIVGAESPAALARPPDQSTVRLSVPEALAAGYVPPTAGQGPAANAEELPAIHAWRPSSAPSGRSVWTVPGAAGPPASEGPTTQIDLRSDDAEAQSTARIDLSLVQAAGVRAAEAAEAERADPAWLEELSSSEIQPLTVPVGEEGEWNVEAAHAALREKEAAALVAAEEAEAARIAQLAAREVSQLRAAEAERALTVQAQQAEALRNADTMSFEAPETREAREQHLRADAEAERAVEAVAQEAEAQRIAAADALVAEAGAAEAQAAEMRQAEARAAQAEARAAEARAAEAHAAEAHAAEARAAEARAAEARAAEARAAEARAAEREAEARAAEARAAEARAAEARAAEARAAEAREAEARQAEAREAEAREAEAREAEARAAEARAAEARAAEAREAEARAAEARAAEARAAEARAAEARAAEAREAEAREAEARAAEARAAEAREAEAHAAEARAAEAREAEARAEARAAEAREAEARAAEARAAEARAAEARAAEARAAEARAAEAHAAEAAEAREAEAREAESRAAEARAALEAQAHEEAQRAERARQATAAAQQAEEAEALRIAQAAAREAAALAAAPRPAETPSSGGPTERVGINVHPIDELPRPIAEADATIADVTFKSWASEVGPASNVPAPAGGATERIDLPPPILFADPEPAEPTPILAVGVATEAALATALPSQTPEPDYALVQPVSEGLRASLPPEEGGTPGLRAPIHLAVREIDDREAVLPFEPPSLGLDPEPTPAPRAAELRVSSKLGSAPLVDEAFARDDQAIQDQSNALSRPRSARTIVERAPSSEVVVEPTGRLEPKSQLAAASPAADGRRIEVASELYRAEAPAPRAKPGDEVITAVEVERQAASKSTATQLKEEEGTQRIDVQQARLDVNEVIAQSAARVPLEARTELLSSAHPPVPAAHPAPTLSTAVSVGPVAPSVEAAREAAKEPPRREVSSAGPVAPSRAPAVDAQDLRRAVGIDIGGRFARVALLELGKVDLLKVDGHAALPAVVALLPSGTLVAGAEALAEPEGNRVSVRALLLAISGLAVAPVENLSGRWVAKIAGENVELLEILRVFFQPLGAAATRALGTPKVRGILLVPPGASHEAIDLVQRAAKATGLDITEAVPEPLAAGRAYDLDRQPVETALVIDVAATHLGATVLRRGREGLRPVGGKSWPSPSGADLDHALGAVVNEEVKKALGRPAPEDASYLAQLEAELERARRDLKREQAVDLKLKVGERAIIVKLARPRAFQATEAVVSEILSKVREVLSEAGVHPRALGAVVVVGSAGGYGGLGQALQALTGREALTSIDPLTGPFHGLTRPSELIKAPEDRLAPSEGIPFDIGIGLPGGRFRALFPAGTKLPAKQSKKHATTKDAQAEMEFSLYEGRGELLAECRPLGTVSLSGLPRAARGQVQVELELELDLDAVLACTLSEPKSGHKRRVELPTANTPAARKKSLESRPSIEDFGTAPKPKTKVGLLGRLLGKS